MIFSNSALVSLTSRCFGTGRVCGDERQVDLRGLRAGELHLGALAGLLEALERHLVGAQVDAVVRLELVGEPVDDLLVPVVAAEVVVAVGRLDLEDALADLHDRDVEGTAAEVEDENGLVLVALVEAVRQRGRGRLVDDAQDLETGDLAGVLGGLALHVVEVRRNGDDRLGDGLAEVLLGVGLELLEDHRRELLGRVHLALDVDLDAAVLALGDLVGHRLALRGGLLELATDETLDRLDGVLRVGDRLVLRGLAHDALAVAECDDRRRGAIAFGVDDDGRLAALEDGHCRVGGTEVDTENLGHCVTPLSNSLSQ